MPTPNTLLRSLALIGAVGVAATGVVACGSSSSSTSSAADTAAATATAGTATTGTAATGTTGTGTTGQKSSNEATATTVAVTLGKPQAFSLVPDATTAKAGKVTFKVKNAGDMTHELVVLKTDTPAKDLPVKNGVADETGNIGETGDMAAGTSKSFTVTMEKGHYVLLCNIAGHYQGGMYSDFTVS